MCGTEGVRKAPALLCVSREKQVVRSLSPSHNYNRNLCLTCNRLDFVHTQQVDCLSDTYHHKLHNSTLLLYNPNHKNTLGIYMATEVVMVVMVEVVEVVKVEAELAYTPILSNCRHPMG